MNRKTNNTMLNPDSSILANYLGLISFSTFTFTLLPTIINLNWLNQIKAGITKNLLKFRNIALAIALFFALVHGLLMTQNSTVDFFSIQTYWIYAEGVATLNILLYLAFSFNEIQDDFKKLRYLAYASILLLSCHISSRLIDHSSILLFFLIPGLALTIAWFVNNVKQKKQLSN